MAARKPARVRTAGFERRSFFFFSGAGGICNRVPELNPVLGYGATEVGPIAHNGHINPNVEADPVARWLVDDWNTQSERQKEAQRSGSEPQKFACYT